MPANAVFSGSYGESTWSELRGVDHTWAELERPLGTRSYAGRPNASRACWALSLSELPTSSHDRAVRGCRACEPAGDLVELVDGRTDLGQGGERLVGLGRIERDARDLAFASTLDLAFRQAALPQGVSVATYVGRLVERAIQVPRRRYAHGAAAAAHQRADAQGVRRGKRGSGDLRLDRAAQTSGTTHVRVTTTRRVMRCVGSPGGRHAVAGGLGSAWRCARTLSSSG